MKLFFWRKSSKASESSGASSKQKAGIQSEPTAAKEVTKYYRIQPLKRWAEAELTPLAWSRVVIRLLPVLRDFGCDFSEIQKPTLDTRVEKDVFFLLIATIEEIYGRTYKPQTKPVAVA